MNDLIAKKRQASGMIVMLAALVAILLVACGGSEEPTTVPASTSTTEPAATEVMTPDPTEVMTPDPTEVPPTATTADAMEPSGDTESIGIRTNSELGEILVDSDGMTLYIFDRDTEGVSNCSGGCLNNWPPYIVDEVPESESGVTANIGTIDLADGTKQVTVNGFPAYYWVGDTAEGDVAGNGVGTVWWVFNPDGTPQRPAKVGLLEDATHGPILVDSEGMTLYIFDRDTEGVSNCSGGCLDNWPPLRAEYGAIPVDDDVTATLDTITRDDGTQQVTINGFPAYYWVGDSAEGDTAGHGVGTVWWVFEADGSPQRPTKVGLGEHPTLGSILVDADGMTLYLFDNDFPSVSNCTGGCLNNWPPLLSEHGTLAIDDVTANLSTITRDDGTMQVTVNQMPVYYWINDASPGDATGQGVGDVWWVLNVNGNAIRN